MTERHAAEFERVWDAAEQGSGLDEIAELLRPVFATMTRDALTRLYPDAAGIFSTAGPSEEGSPQPGAVTAVSR